VPCHSSTTQASDYPPQSICARLGTGSVAANRHALLIPRRSAGRSSPAPHWQSKPHSQSGTNLSDGRGTAATEPTWLDRVDGYQQSHRWLAIPFAVFRKFIDDQAGSLAALIAYYAFFSIFPLLLTLTTILGYVLAGNPALEQRIFSTALSQFSDHRPAQSDPPVDG
jgi:hypothetical protein